MKIVIIRHADPDNINNCLTEAGKIEAEALGKHYNASMFDDIYSSTLPRAVLTAQAVIKGEKEIKQVDWLREFFHDVTLEDGKKHLNWDFLPSFLEKHQEFLSPNYFEDCKEFKDVEMQKHYENVVNEFDKVLEKNGYKRDGHYYKVVDSNQKTIVFFCHFGMMCVLMSHLFNIPYTILTNFTVCQPSGVTTFVTEEREKGIAEFRMLEFGDVSHLKMEGIKPSFSARFCEIFDSEDRH